MNAANVGSGSGSFLSGWAVLAGVCLVGGCGGSSSSTTTGGLVPAGTYTIGSDDGQEDAPLRTVTLAAFEIDLHEVTNKEFSRFVYSDDCPGPLIEGNPDPCVYDGAVQSNTREKYWGNTEFETYPVINIRWDQAEAYCRWAGKRLPTEAEWEVAARGAELYRFPWGADEPTCDLANYEGCTPDTLEVESLADGVSPFGAFEMSGNVAEWVQDYYNSSYYTWGPSDDPQGPDTGSSRVVRGGSWYCDTTKVTPSFRDQANPLLQYNDIGFRCARSAE